MKSNILKLFSIAIITAAVVSCANPGIKVNHSAGKILNSDKKTVIVTQNIPYREGNSKSWTLDMAMPANFGSNLRPAIVIVHGGGWSMGSKTDAVYQNLMVKYANKGYVTINVNYRLTGEAPFPACIEDVKCAVRWLRAHAEEYMVDTGRIGGYGHSAGGHLALMLAVCPKSANLEGDGGWNEYSSRLNVVIGGSAATELGRDVPMAKPVWWPIGYISSNNPPMLLIQGGDDMVVKPNLTEDFVQKMKAAGANIEYLKVEKVGHGVAFMDRLDITDPAMDNFFEKYLKPGL
jgi:acetyl esterase/lipase